MNPCPPTVALPPWVVISTRRRPPALASLRGIEDPKAQHRVSARTVNARAGTCLPVNLRHRAHTGGFHRPPQHIVGEIPDPSLGLTRTLSRRG